VTADAFAVQLSTPWELWAALACLLVAVGALWVGTQRARERVAWFTFGGLAVVGALALLGVVFQSLAASVGGVGVVLVLLLFAWLWLRTD
jgi:hypothetical protein